MVVVATNAQDVQCYPPRDINFDGICILYADFEKGGANSKLMMRSSSRENCNIPVYISVFACIFYTLILGCYKAYAARKSRTNQEQTKIFDCWMACILFLLQVALGILRFNRNRRLRHSSSDRERIRRPEPTA
ncbi:uncharacterized protein [Mytilus edulis]|uniref:uncharacterized protein n=1 Tax=Mytilus edulis TaxID=6550 RepID=UPI0039F09FF9